MALTCRRTSQAAHRPTSSTASAPSSAHRVTNSPTTSVTSSNGSTTAAVVISRTRVSIGETGRQVSAISWVELDEEIVIRKGRMLRTLVSVPYGRLQYVDIQSGPLARANGIASCEIHTASPESGGSLPGLPVAEAEALRSRLAARGEAQRAGL